jgi:hypothetical protein
MIERIYEILMIGLDGEPQRLPILAEYLRGVRDEDFRECAALMCGFCLSGDRAYVYAGTCFHVIPGVEQAPLCQASAIREAHPEAFR